MVLQKTYYLILVHCRIGSLENETACGRCGCGVHCRIGSLEISHEQRLLLLNVHCRIGSLEINL